MTQLVSIPRNLIHQDDDDRALSLLPLWSDRMTYHRKRLQATGYRQGFDGITSYKTKYPEAASIQLHLSSVASVNKPKGYDDFLCKLIDTWFISDTALNESNRLTVERLNIAMSPRWFDPDRHFSVKLSAVRLKKLAAVFDQHGARLDTSKAMSMSAVRSAVKVAKGRRTSGQPFGAVGHIIGSQLIIGSHGFTVMQHNGHDCIKIAIDGKRIWQRLDVAAAFIASAGLVSGDDPEYLLSVAIREMVPDAENSAADPLADMLETNSPSDLVLEPEPSQQSSGEWDLVSPLRKRIATSKAACLGGEQAHFTACPDDPYADPLAFLPGELPADPNTSLGSLDLGPCS